MRNHKEAVTIHHLGKMRRRSYIFSNVLLLLVAYHIIATSSVNTLGGGDVTWKKKY